MVTSKTKEFFNGAIILALLFVACSCSIRNDLIDLQNDIDELRFKVEEMNTSINALQVILGEIRKGGLITSIASFEEDGETTGYELSFYDGRTITIRQGKDGHSPQIGVAQDGFGRWCWTLDGDWLLDGSGNTIPAAAANGIDGADGLTPQVKIIEGYWFISTDNGETWTRLARAQGLDAVSVFSRIDTSAEEYVELYLADGNSIRIPRYIPLVITLDIQDEENGLSAGETREFRYELSGRVTDDTIVTAGTDGKYSLTITRLSKTTGVVAVTCPKEFREGFVYLLANDGEGHSVVKVINFYERALEVTGSPTYWVDCTGGTITLPINYNFAFSLEVEGSAAKWLHPVQTKASNMAGEITVVVDSNTENYVRKGRILIHPADHPEYTFSAIAIEEASAFFSISQASLVVESEGRAYTVSITSSRGISVSSEASWVKCSLESDQNYNWTLYVEVDKNAESEQRRASIDVKTTDGSEVLGSISVLQLAYDVDPSKCFVLKVKTSSLYDCKVVLPIRMGSTDCVVDWGDGIKESYSKDYSISQELISHTYVLDNIDAAEFTVSVSGSVWRLEQIPIPFADEIISIEQWGNLGVSYVQSAFSHCSRLVSVPEDYLGFFSEVNDISGLFRYCKSLKTVPEGLFSYAEKVSNASELFYGSGIEVVPSGLFSHFNNLETVYSCFENCSNLRAIPAELFSNCPAAFKISNLENLFTYSALESIPEALLDACTSVTDVSGIFRQTFIKKIPEKLFYNNKLITDVGRAFSGCSQLTAVPISIFDENRRIIDFSHVFDGDYLNMSPQETPYTVIDGKKIHLYERKDYPDEFVTPRSFGNALTGLYKTPLGYNNFENIPASWR